MIFYEAPHKLLTTLKDMAEIFKTAKADVNSFAVDRFKVKKIKEPTYQ